ncbi:LytTR family DNA-binding domain-containing protein [soil metagenome]
MNCLIVDDEILAQDVIEHHISKIGFLNLKKKCTNALEAFAILNSEKIDVIFLDIKMPEITGIDFVKSLKYPPKIIFTTAYPEFAIEGFELEVIDYLLKPVSFERFSKAIQKLKNNIFSENSNSNSNPNPNDFFIKSDRKQIKISPNDILYIEGLKNYLMIYTKSNSKRIITHSTFKNMQEELSGYQFFVRVHKSFIINTNHITSIENSNVTIDQKKIPLGNNYKALFRLKMRI